MPQVSIVIPCWNCERQVARCLDSVLAQTFADWEAVVVNDGSTDGSAEILARYAAKDPRIRVVTQENRGQAAARNRALGLASGEYVAFLDADDFYDADFLRDLVSEARRTGADVVMTNTRFVDGESRRETGLDRRVLTDFAAKVGVLPHGGVWDKAFRASLIRDSGMTFPEGRCYEDTPFLVKALFHANALAVTGGAAYNYVTNPDSTLHNPAHERKRQKDGVAVAREIFGFAKENGLETACLTDFCLRNVLNVKKMAEEDFLSMKDVLAPTPYLERQVRRRIRRDRRRKILGFLGRLVPLRTKPAGREEGE